MEIGAFVSRLESVHRSGSHWYAKCPAHEDKQASLSVSIGDSGAILVKCHAGCAAQDVVGHLGLEMTDLAPERRLMSVGEIVATYDYTDESGTLLYQAVRMSPKDFRQRRPEGNGWAWNLQGVRRVLYRLPELTAAKGRNVFIVEGEKDVDALRELGLVATTNAMGAGKWASVAADAARILAGQSVIVLPDNDKAGEAHAESVASSLAAVALSVKVLRLPGLAEHGDVSDWLRHGGTRDALIELARKAPTWKPTALAAGSSLPVAPVRSRALTVRMVDVVEAPIRWLWKGWLAFGKVGVLDGNPGLGKSTMTLEIAARGSRGECLPGMTEGIRFATVIISAEDGLADTIKPRLLVAGADPRYIEAILGIPGEHGRPPRSVSLQSADLPYIEGVVVRLREELGCPILVVIDPLMAFIGGKTDSFKDQDIRSLLAPLAAMTERTDSSMLLVRHLNKGQGSAISRGGGSIGIIGAARTGMIVERDPDDPKLRVLAQIKNNVGVEAMSLRWRLESCGAYAKIEWLGVTGLTADDLVTPGDPDGERGSFSEARVWLDGFLGDGAKAASAVYAGAKRDHISERTLNRAKRDLGIVSRKVGNLWTWALPALVGDDLGNLPSSSYVTTTNNTGMNIANEGCQRDELAMLNGKVANIAKVLPLGVGNVHSPHWTEREPGEDDD